jgi:hypothetical protein
VNFHGAPYVFLLIISPDAVQMGAQRIPKPQPEKTTVITEREEEVISGHSDNIALFH